MTASKKQFNIRNNRTWPLKYRLYQRAHGVANRLAWKFANPEGEAWGRALRIDRDNLWWRLNDYFGSKYLNWWVREMMNNEKEK